MGPSKEQRPWDSNGTTGKTNREETHGQLCRVMGGTHKGHKSIQAQWGWAKHLEEEYFTFRENEPHLVELRDHSWWAWGPYRMPEIEPRLATCEANVLPKSHPF